MSFCERRRRSSSSSDFGGKLGFLLMVILSLCFLHSLVHGRQTDTDKYLNSVVASISTDTEKVKEDNIQRLSRKLLTKVVKVGVTDRIGESCSRDDIAVYQGATAPLPNGIPTYTVQILNVCNSGCAISGIHVSCGWFSSARMINPKIFRRVGYDDCLVNDGAAIGPGGSLSFQYANTFRYPLSVSSVTC